MNFFVLKPKQYGMEPAGNISTSFGPPSRPPKDVSFTPPPLRPPKPPPYNASHNIADEGPPTVPPRRRNSPALAPLVDPVWHT